MTRSSPRPGPRTAWDALIGSDQWGADRTRVWVNFSNTRSLRLTEHATAVLMSKQPPLQYWSFRTPQGRSMTNKQLLQMDRQMLGPYFIRGRTELVLFGEQDAMMMILNGNDLARYLDSLSQ